MLTVNHSKVPQVFITTLQFGEYKAEFANVEKLSIKLNEFVNKEEGFIYYSIHLDVYTRFREISEMINAVAYIPITKDVYDLINIIFFKLENEDFK